MWGYIAIHTLHTHPQRTPQLGQPQYLPGQLILMSQGSLAHENLISADPRARCLSARGEPGTVSAQGTTRVCCWCLSLTSTKTHQQLSEAPGLGTKGNGSGSGAHGFMVWRQGAVAGSSLWGCQTQHSLTRMAYSNPDF